MRTNVVIDDRLMSRAIKSGGYRTKKSAIEAGLHLLVQVHSQKKLRRASRQSELGGRLRGNAKRLRWSS